MFNHKLILFAFVAAAAAQSSSTARSSSTTGSATGTASSSPPSLPAIPTCVLNCVIPAAAQNNCNFADAQCVCGSAQFQADATACLNANCTSSEVEAARALQQSQCGPIGVTPSGSASPRPVSTSSGGLGPSALPTPTSPASTASSPGSQTQSTAPAATSSNAASPPALDGTWAFAAAILGAVVAL